MPAYENNKKKSGERKPGISSVRNQNNWFNGALSFT